MEFGERRCQTGLARAGEAVTPPIRSHFAKSVPPHPAEGTYLPARISALSLPHAFGSGIASIARSR